MDNKNEAASTQNVNNQQTVASATTTGSQNTENKPQSQKPKLLFAMVIIIVILAVAAFLLPSKKMEDTGDKKMEIKAGVTSTVGTDQGISPISSSPETQEVDQVMIDDNLDSEFTSIDRDLEQL